MVKRGPDPVDIYVGSRVRALRLKQGMSQEGLGKELGLTFQQVQKYEKGTNRVSASRLQQIASILKVPETFFFDGAPQSTVRTKRGEAEPFSYVNKFLTSPDGLPLIKAFRQIGNAEIRRSIVRLVENIVDAEMASPRRERAR
jgi:transcriptional regulator with XRE-family HTH domain